MNLNPEYLEKWLSILEKVIVIIGAVIAAIKFNVFGRWEEQYRTDMECTYHQDKGVILADYTIANIGDRPFFVKCVRLDLYPAIQEAGGHLVPNKKQPLVPSEFLAPNKDLASRLGEFDPAKHHFKELQTLGYLGKGERTVFTLRCQVAQPLPEVFFVVAEWWRMRRFSKQYKHSFFRYLHVETAAEKKSKDAAAASA